MHPLRLISVFLLSALSFIAQPVIAAGATQPPPGTVWLDGKPVESIAHALQQAEDGSHIQIGRGQYQDGGVLGANNVMIEGAKGARLHSKAVKGKAALVIQGRNTLVKGIECYNIQVADQNGACVRMEGKHLILENVYFHDSEQGLLTHSEPGDIHINNSRFERLGKAGRAHAVYVGGGRLFINGSHFVASVGEGHEIKSRARETHISGSVIANLDGHDSRLVDVPNGGVLKIVDSVLEQSEQTSNWNLIGFGHEGYKYDKNSIHLEGNLFLLDRNTSLVLEVKSSKVAPSVVNNVFVGKMYDAYPDDNLQFKHREEAGIMPYPHLPKL